MLNKSFQKHILNERKALLPAVLKAFSTEVASDLAAHIDGAVADADKAKRDEKREEAAKAKRDEEKSIREVADLQREFAASALGSMMERNAKVHEIARRASTGAMGPLGVRLDQGKLPLLGKPGHR